MLLPLCYFKLTLYWFLWCQSPKQNYIQKHYRTTTNINLNYVSLLYTNIIIPIITFTGVFRISIYKSLHNNRIKECSSIQLAKSHVIIRIIRGIITTWSSIFGPSKHITKIWEHFGEQTVHTTVHIVMMARNEIRYDTMSRDYF